MAEVLGYDARPLVARGDPRWRKRLREWTGHSGPWSFHDVRDRVMPAMLERLSWDGRMTWPQHARDEQTVRRRLVVMGRMIELRAAMELLSSEE